MTRSCQLNQAAMFFQKLANAKGLDGKNTTSKYYPIKKKNNREFQHEAEILQSFQT